MTQPLAFDIIARDRASQTTQRIGRNFEKFGTATKGVFAGAGAAVGVFAVQQLGQAGRAVAAFVADSIKKFSDFDRSMREVWTLLPDLSEAGFKELQGDVRAFVTEMGIAHGEAVPALYQAISAGVPQDNVFEFLTTAAKFSIGGVTNLETAVDGLTSVTNAYGRELLSAEKASDIFFTTVRLGKTNASQLSASLFQVIPTAAALGVSFETVGAALAAVTAQGVPTSVATTQLRQLLVELNKEGGKTASLFDDLAGKSFADFIAGGGSVQDALSLMAQHAEESGTSLSNLFGSVEAGNAALALTSEGGAKAFNDALGQMQDASGATDEAFARMDEGMGRTWDKLMVRIDDLKVGLGESLAPAIEAVLDWFERLGDESTETGEKFSEFASAAEKEVDSKILPALARFRDSAAETGSENEQLAFVAIEAMGSLASFWINNIRFIMDALQRWKDLVVEVWRGLGNAALTWAETTLNAAEFAFGWVPGLGDQLRDMQDRFKRFREIINEQLDRVKSRVNIRVHTRFTSSGNPPAFGGAAGVGSRSVAVQHGGEITGPPGIDRVPAMLTAGEFVIRRERAQENLALLRAINAGTGVPNIPRFANGGARNVRHAIRVFDAGQAPRGGGSGGTIVFELRGVGSSRRAQQFAEDFRHAVRTVPGLRVVVKEAAA